MESMGMTLAAKRERIDRLETILLPLVAFALLVVVWHVGVLVSGTEIFPTPLKVLRGLRELYQNGLLFRYTRDSLFRVAAGYGLAVVIGVPTGFLLGWFPPAQALCNSVFQMLRPISPLAWIPVAILLFGVNNKAAIFLVFLSSFFPIVISATTGVQNVPSMYTRAGANFGLSTLELLRRVVLPAALPNILTGFRLSLGVAWLVLVAAEMVSVPSGLGYLVMDSRNAGQRYDLVVASMLIIGLIGFLLDLLMRRLETVRSVRWGFRTEDI
jgi:NitT/TauT family transport system permease protein